MKIVLVAAIGENNVIGRDGQLPWRLKSDLKHFRALTLDKPVIMGRKTFQSIGKALDRRSNIVITRDPKFSAEGVVTAASLQAALDLARKDAEKRGANEIMIIGGADIFAAACRWRTALRSPTSLPVRTATSISLSSMRNIGTRTSARNARPGRTTALATRSRHI